ncbi:N-acetylmuramoyl-L-alanine amidase [Mycolicibacterium brumae]|uniref:Cold-shock protein n=1 Tax=Mycolicibacterium brumae TaxID=85968 RepID=A0A2G5PDC6_9MYCO|nr:N-acetylmuramoyl-L-alanine amidase [Mycolicibacterium brumae]MCV7191788.1 LGFP repeat-containing protein [Mycolicibacterium brumae]PIB76328.1 cold-shock protein [Mycolicibacterium brumae]RWA15836.1 hypothetical protein MBRU_09815 [Mycolicibacterium brumae DSM 44177]UWW07094.1 N-acetylmuramoyl-L-alanine amidase [Mycolicibacterium brumae]
MPSPRPLLSAIAVTAVLLPWAVNGLPQERPRPSAADVSVVEQPLPEVAGGTTIREINRDQPFSMVALTGDDLTGTSAQFRARQSDGSWGQWYEADPLEADGGLARGTDPIFVGRTNAVQIKVTRPDDAPVTAPDTTARDDSLGYRPVNVEEPLNNLNAVLIDPPLAPADGFNLPTAAIIPGQPPAVISRAQWGADEGLLRCGSPTYDAGVRAAVVHHTAGSNDYSPEESAAIVRSIYAYHTVTLGWCDMAYNALVDKYGQVFEGRAGGLDRPVEGAHTGGFNLDTWGVAMLGDFETEAPTEIQLRNTGRLLGWRLALDHVDPNGTVRLTSAGGAHTFFPAGATPTLPTIFAHRDVGITECPGAVGYTKLAEIRQIAAHFDRPAPPRTLEDQLRGGAIYATWQNTGAGNGLLGMPTSPESAAAGDARYATFERGAVYWSPSTGAKPLTGAIYTAWATLGFERGLLGLPTSREIAEPQWIKQNFQHGTLNFDRETGTVTRVVDGVAQQLPHSDGAPPVQLERISRIS